MAMRWGLLVVVVAVGLTACSAVMVSKPRPEINSPYAPVNAGEEAQEGTVKYLPGGADSIVDARRADAFKQMHDACRGSYEITKEEDHNDGGTGTVAYGVLVAEPLLFHFIHFRCVRTN